MYVAEDLNPGSSLFSQLTEFCPAGVLNSYFPDQELRGSTKELASRLRLTGSPQASLQCRIFSSSHFNEWLFHGETLSII